MLYLRMLIENLSFNIWVRFVIENGHKLSTYIIYLFIYLHYKIHAYDEPTFIILLGMVCKHIASSNKGVIQNSMLRKKLLKSIGQAFYVFLY
jgi:hypothetical protein